MTKEPGRRVIPLFRILVALELLSGSLLLIFGHRMLPQWLQVDPSASAVDIPQQFLSRCQWLLEGHGGLSDDDTPPFYNPRSAQPSDNQGSVLIKNCTLWDGISDSPVYPMDILVLNGTVQSIDRDIRAPRGVRIIHAHGRIVTPGLVDVHSHSGLSSWPAYDGNDDVNEASSPLTPQMRSLDGFSLHDNSFYLVTTGGVTTSLILPGSANLMGGEAFVVKHRRSRRNSVEEMRVDWRVSERDPHRWRWMKMALGENPKRVHGQHSPSGPQTRMGNSYLMRAQLNLAQTKMFQLEQWCRRHVKNSISDFDIDFRVWDDFPKYESLIALLKSQVRLNVHVYETHDIEALLRLSHEFNFTIAAIHHATSAHLVADLLKMEREQNPRNSNLSVALFTDKGYYKAEAYYASTKAPSILKAHGIPFAIKSDHSVTNAQFLAWHAAKAVHYGLREADAMRAITREPAKILGLQHRIGSLRPGMDGDLVVWDGGSPLRDIGSRPALVVIDGDSVYETADLLHFANNVDNNNNNNNAVPLSSDTDSSSSIINSLSSICNSNSDYGDSEKSSHLLSLLLRNIGHVHLNESTVLRNASLLIRFDGIGQDSRVTDNSITFAHRVHVECVSSDECNNSANDNATVIIDFKGTGAFMPSPVAVSSLGLVEVSAESVTKNGGWSGAPFDWQTMDGGPMAADGLEWGIGNGMIADGGFSKQLEMASRQGIAFNIAVPDKPPNGGLVFGQSSLMRTGSAAGDPNGLLVEDLAVHVGLGKDYRRVGSVTSAIHGQLLYLRTVLRRALNELEYSLSNRTSANDRLPLQNSFSNVLLGRKPLVVHADNADQILALLRLTGQIEQSVKRIIAASNQNPSPVFTGIRLIIAGGAEAWLVAEQMRKHNVSGVLLYPVNCYPEHHDSRRCRSLSSLENPILLKISKRNGTHYTPPVSGLSILRRHGIKVAIAAESNNMVHDLYFDAGWAEWLSDRRIDGSAIQPEANYTRISPHDAVGMISWRVAEMFGISDFYAAQTFTNFVIFAGDHPMKSVKTAVGLAVNQIATDSWLIRCMPNQL